MGLEINEITQGEYVFLFGDLHWLAWLALEIGISRDSLACDMTTLEAPFCRLRAGTGENAMLVVFAKDLNQIDSPASPQANSRAKAHSANSRG